MRREEMAILTSSVTHTHQRYSATVKQRFRGGPGAVMPAFSGRKRRFLVLANRTCEIRFVLPRPQSVRTSCVRTHVGGELFILECECDAEERSVCYRLMSPSFPANFNQPNIRRPPLPWLRNQRVFHLTSRQAEDRQLEDELRLKSRDGHRSRCLFGPQPASHFVLLTFGDTR